MRELALIAEHGGMDSIWVADHIFFETGEGPVRGAWESIAMLGALAEATSRVEFGPLVFCTPFRNAGMIAWSANTLDHISGGRFVLGLGAGWHQPEFDAFSFEFDHKVSLFEDSLEVMIPLLREGRVDYDGKWASGHAELRPPGTRAGGPPIMLAGSKPRMLGLAAKWADRWNTVWYGLPTDEFRDERSNLDEALAAAGRATTEVEVSAGIVISDPRTVDANGPEAIVGRAENIAEALVAWRDEGVAEVMCRMEPPSTAMAEEIVRGMELARA
jgi:alkanesulfonate monooxygenase SsuD/methylene tetrahydromethanopterin reductase-like flavin-dependent oxidoreductase (luciferase family)